MRKYYLLISLLVLTLSAKGNISDTIKLPSAGFPAKDFELQNAILTVDPSGKEAFSIKDLTYKGNSNPFVTDILLSFNEESSVLKKDDTGKYIIKNADYKFIKGKGVLGNGAAFFYNNEHIVEIEGSKNLWLGSCEDLGSFSIEFRLLPVSFNNDSILFSRVGYFSGRKNGIEVKIKDRKMTVELFRLFKDTQGVRYDVKLVKGKVLELGKWHHFILSYDRISGKLTKCMDGAEDDVLYITETDRPFENVYEPSFECIDMPAAVIGKDYFGYIDEFRISYEHIDNLKKENELAYDNYKKIGLTGRQPFVNSGIITSPVYTFESTGTSVKQFTWSEILLANTFIWMEFRTSDSMFRLNDNELKWYRINNNQKNIYLMRHSGEFLRGKYYQWRANLVPSPDGKYSPYLYNVEVNYQLDPSPKAPLFVDVISTGDKSVRLRWSKNVEHDLLGYRIYYGLNSKIYDGIISYINNNKITNELNSSRKYVEIELTNAVIEENKQKNNSGVLDYPFFENSVLYFFSVSAYDSYKPETPHNHESSLSREVTGRPFAGSEIKL
jgi:hypothetical protein